MGSRDGGLPPTLPYQSGFATTQAQQKKNGMEMALCSRPQRLRFYRGRSYKCHLAAQPARVGDRKR
jgi:hypothetical protein